MLTDTQDIENSVVIQEYQQMDRVLKEERTYCGRCNVHSNAVQHCATYNRVLHTWLALLWGHTAEQAMPLTLRTYLPTIDVR